MSEELNGKWMCNREGYEFWNASDKFDTKEEAVNAGLDTLREYNDLPDSLKDNMDLSDMLNIMPDDYENILAFDVGQACAIGVSIDVDNILEGISESAYDEGGESAEGYLSDVLKEHKEELETLIHEWFVRHDYLPSFYTINNVETINLSEVD